MVLTTVIIYLWCIFFVRFMLFHRCIQFQFFTVFYKSVTEEKPLRPQNRDYSLGEATYDFLSFFFTACERRTAQERRAFILKTRNSLATPKTKNEFVKHRNELWRTEKEQNASRKQDRERNSSVGTSRFRAIRELKKWRRRRRGQRLVENGFILYLRLDLLSTPIGLKTSSG